MIVINIPGRDDRVARAASPKADTLVTPINDSFVEMIAGIAVPSVADIVDEPVAAIA